MTVAVFAGVLFLFSVVSRRLAHTVVTAPIVFTVGGMLYVWLATDVAHI
jgi:hypothetical protein